MTTAAAANPPGPGRDARAGAGQASRGLPRRAGSRSTTDGHWRRLTGGQSWPEQQPGQLPGGPCPGQQHRRRVPAARRSRTRRARRGSRAGPSCDRLPSRLTAVPWPAGRQGHSLVGPVQAPVRRASGPAGRRGWRRGRSSTGRGRAARRTRTRCARTRCRSARSRPGSPPAARCPGAGRSGCRRRRSGTGAIAASAVPAAPAASKSASRWVASTWMVPCARDSRRSESILRIIAGIRRARHSSSRMTIRTGPPGSSMAACPHEDTQARVIATVSSPRPAIRDRSTVWIGAVKSGRTVVGPSNRPDRLPATMLPSASAAGRIISRSRCGRGDAQLRGHVGGGVAEQVPDLGDGGVGRGGLRRRPGRWRGGWPG